MKITVITATYNSGKTVRDTLESVLRQSYQDYEYLIVDGASQDDTLEIVRSYEKKFAGRMRVVSEPDKGIYDAMNKGIHMATGEVVGLLNSDDFYTADDVLQHVADAFAKDKTLDAVYGDIHFVHQDNLKKHVRYYSSEHFKRAYMRFGFMPAHPSFYCRKAAYERHGYFDTSYQVASDFENLLRLIFLGRIKTQYIKKDFVTMRTGGASTAGLNSRRMIMQDHLRAMRENGIYSNFLLLSLRYMYKIYELMRR